MLYNIVLASAIQQCESARSIHISALLKGFPDSSVGKESACNAANLGSIPGLGRFSWRRERLPTPVFWPGEFHGVVKSQT